MYPVLFEVGGFEITSFGVLVALGALTGLWVFQRQLRRAHLPDSGVDAALAGVLCGLAGAKLLWVLEHLGTDSWTNLLFSRGGLSWFGGFAGGLLGAMIVIRRHQLPLLAIVAAATPALAIGHAIGRVGCLLVGDDYGTPSSLPWAIAFPEGLPPTDVPVHPTQIYEAIALVPIAALLSRLLRNGAPDRVVLGTYLVLTAGVRFLIQWIRVYDPVIGPLGLAHLAALLAIAAGAYLLLGNSAESRPARV
jgi:phosphatidylglycerol:prolipoprotein diacylglycerol transferase